MESGDRSDALPRGAPRELFIGGAIASWPPLEHAAHDRDQPVGRRKVAPVERGELLHPPAELVRGRVVGELNDEGPSAGSPIPARQVTTGSFPVACRGCRGPSVEIREVVHARTIAPSCLPSLEGTRKVFGNFVESGRPGLEEGDVQRRCVLQVGVGVGRLGYPPYLPGVGDGVAIITSVGGSATYSASEPSISGSSPGLIAVGTSNGCASIPGGIVLPAAEVLTCTNPFGVISAR